MHYTNFKYAFEVEFDQFNWDIHETIFHKKFLITLIHKTRNDVLINLKVVPRKEKSFTPLDYFKHDKEELKKIHDDIKFTVEKNGTSNLPHHIAYFNTIEKAFRRILFQDKSFLYLISLKCPIELMSSFKNDYKFFVNSFKTTQFKKSVKTKKIVLSSNLSYLKIQGGGRFLTGDVTIGPSDIGFIISSLDFKCFDQNGKLNTNLIHQSNELTRFGLNVFGKTKRHFTNVCETGVLHFLLPHHPFSNTRISKIQISVFGRFENGFRLKETITRELKEINGVLLFPMHGKWTVINGPGLYQIHKDAIGIKNNQIFSPQNFALDLVKINNNQSSFENNGRKNSDYFCFNEKIFSPISGKVIEVQSTIHDNLPQDRNQKKSRGNFILLQTRNKDFLLLAHLKYKSIKINKNDQVKKGEFLGLIGNSGRSSEPHLHIHLSDNKHKVLSNGKPMLFKKFGFILAGSFILN